MILGARNWKGDIICNSCDQIFTQYKTERSFRAVSHEFENLPMTDLQTNRPDVYKFESCTIEHPCMICKNKKLWDEARPHKSTERSFIAELIREENYKLYLENYTHAKLPNGKFLYNKNI